MAARQLLPVRRLSPAQALAHSQRPTFRAELDSPQQRERALRATGPMTVLQASERAPKVALAQARRATALRALEYALALVLLVSAQRVRSVFWGPTEPLGHAVSREP